MLYKIASVQANKGAHGLIRWWSFKCERSISLLFQEKLVPNFLHMVVSWREKALTILEAACIKSFLIHYKPGNNILHQRFIEFTKESKI